MNLHLIFTQPSAQNGLLSKESVAVIDALDRVLVRAQFQGTNQSLSNWWCNYFGVKTDPADLPLAMLNVEQELSTDSMQRHPYWLLAQPVHLALQRDTFQISLISNLSRPDLTALLAALNQHFQQDGLEIVEGKSGQWFLGSSQPLPITALLPEQVHGQLLNHVLPSGDGAASWRRISNEVQMLWFDHPVNQAREASGLSSVSGIWLYGGALLGKGNIIGQYQRQTVIHAQSALLTGLANLTQTTDYLRPKCSPDTFVQLLTSNQSHILVYDGLDEISIQQVKVLCDAVNKGTLGSLQITLSVGGELLQYQYNRWDKLKFWRKNSTIKPKLASLGWL